MKKTNFTDKIVISIIALNLLSFSLGHIFYGMLNSGSLLYDIVSINFFYIIFGIPLSIFAGVMLNITSLVWKSKTKISYKLNIWLLIILLLMLPDWLYFLWQLFMSLYS